MNASFVRRVLPIAAIGAAGIYAFHDVLLEPQKSAKAEAQERLVQARQRAEADGTLRGAKVDIEARLAGSRSNLQYLRERSRVALDQRELFERITALAHESRIDLDQIRALDWKPRATASADAASACPASACAVSLTGRYSDLTAFVGNIETHLGLTTVTHLRVRPAIQGDRVDAELELACFAAAPVVADTRGTENGQ